MKTHQSTRYLVPAGHFRSAIYPYSLFGESLWFLRENWTEFGPFRTRRKACAAQRVSFWKRRFDGSRPRDV